MKPVVYASICSCLNVRMCVYGFTREAARAPQIEIRSAVCKKRCHMSDNSNVQNSSPLAVKVKFSLKYRARSYGTALRLYFPYPAHVYP